MVIILPPPYRDGWASAGVINVEFGRTTPRAFKTLELNIKSLQNLEGRVGWIDGTKYPNGLPVAAAAAMNELGHGPTPPRPTIRPTADAKKGEWTAVAAQAAKAVINGQLSAENAMEQITVRAKDDIEQAILEITQPALSPITLELRAMKKKNPNLIITGKVVGEAAWRIKQPGYQTPNVNDKPLIDSGRMISDLNHIVIKT